MRRRKPEGALAATKLDDIAPTTCTVKHAINQTVGAEDYRMFMYLLVISTRGYIGASYFQWIR